MTDNTPPAGPPELPPSLDDFNALGAEPGGSQLEATQLLSNIPFGAIIGNPLVAAIEAQALAAGTTLRYILSVLYGTDMLDNYGTEEYISGGTDEILSVTLNYSINGQSAKLTVPLLVLVPIPYLNIDTMDINFKADINASTSFTQTNSDGSQSYAGISASSPSGILSWLGGSSISGGAGYSSKTDSTATSNSKYSVEYTMNVSVHATSEDMPAGTAKVLNILGSSISEGY